jgi:hypothetical protein
MLKVKGKDAYIPVMKAYRWSRGVTSLIFFYLDGMWKWVGKPSPASLLTKFLRFPLNRRIGAP